MKRCHAAARRVGVERLGAIAVSFALPHRLPKKKRPFAAYAAKGLDRYPGGPDHPAKAIVLTISPDSQGAIYSPFAFYNDTKILTATSRIVNCHAGEERK